MDSEEIGEVEAPAVQLFKLLTRTITATCGIYSPEEKNIIRYMLATLHHNQACCETETDTRALDSDSHTNTKH